MSTPAALRPLLVVNPSSGRDHQTDWLAAIAAHFTGSPYAAEVLTLSGKGDDQALRERIAQCHPNRLVAVGGNDTVKMVAEAALEADLPLGIVPAGSANGMARELDLLTDPAEALVAAGREKAVDVLYLNGTDLCLHLSDIGLNAQLVRHAERRNWLGMLGYARAAFWALWRRLIKVSIQCDGEAVERAALMVVLANARLYSSGAAINPDGDVADGCFEVVVLRRLAGRELLKMFWRFRPFDSAAVEIFSTTSACLDTGRPAAFQVDGEWRGRTSHVEASIRPGALRMLVPDIEANAAGH